MALSQTKLNEEIRKKYMEKFIDFAKNLGEDVQVIASNSFGFPTTDSENNDKSLIITLKVPKDDTDDIYEQARQYQKRCVEKAEKEKERKKKAEEKAKRDAERRAKKKEKAE